jgi:hypothetical protein
MEREHLKYLRHRWNVNVKINIQEIGWMVELDSSGSEYGTVMSYCEHGN